MGKRELLLVVCFIVVGVVVYQATAPPPAPGSEGFSVGKLVDRIRREVRGNHAQATVTKKDTVTISPETAEIRLDSEVPEVTITGEARTDIQYEFRVRSTGADEADARKWAEASTLKFSESGGTLSVETDFPEEARQWGTIVMTVPARLRVRVQPGRFTATITGVAAVEMVEGRGEVVIRDVATRVTANYRGGELTIERAGALKLNARGTAVRGADVSGDASPQLQAGEFRGERFTGALDVDSSSTDIRIEQLADARGPIRVNSTGGTVTLRGVATETRVDGRRSEILVALARPAPLAIYSEGEDVEVTAPRGGFELDAIAKGGSLDVPDGFPAATGDEGERRAAGAVAGGGPTITLRVTDGGVTIRRPEETTTPAGQ